MKVNILRANLVKELNAVGRITAGSHSTLPILANVLLDATDEGLRLGGTNLDVGLSTTLAASVSEGGMLTVPARLFGELIKSIPGDDVELVADDDTLHITGGNYKANLKGLSAEEFPLQSFNEVTNLARVSGDLFKRAIGRVAIAAGVDEGRPILTGVHCELSGTTMRLSATDGYRMMQESLPVLSPVEDIAVIIPAKTLQELGRIIRTGDEVEIGLANNQLVFRLPETVFYGATLSGNYPQVSAIIPENFKATIVLDSEDLRQAVKVSYVFAKESANILRITLAKDELVIEATGAETGDNTGRVDAMITLDDNYFSIGVNAKYLLDALNGVDTPQTVIKLVSSGNPLILSPMGDDSDFKAVIMPMAISG